MAAIHHHSTNSVSANIDGRVSINSSAKLVTNQPNRRKPIGGQVNPRADPATTAAIVACASCLTCSCLAANSACYCCPMMAGVGGGDFLAIFCCARGLNM